MKVWSCTDKGPCRPQNQDSCFCHTQDGEGWAVAAVCDGMGGAKSGNVASSLAVNVFSEITMDGMSSDMQPRHMGQLMKTAAESANDAVYDMSLSSDEFSGMGTTLVAVAMTKKACAVLNIGDSRAYLVSSFGIRQITKDHSLVEELIDRGELRREDAATYPRRNLITRAVGTARQVRADLFYPEVRDGDAILLCSDGLSNIVSDQEILFEILHTSGTGDCCRRLVEMGVSRGAPDNVTAVLVKKEA